MTNRYDVVSAKKDREGKTRWTKIGVMFPAKQGDGFTIKLEAYPLPNEQGEVWISAFVPRENEGSPAARRPSPTRAPTRDELNDEIPF